MENFLFKKSYQLNTFLSLPYKSLWGAKGIFTTVRLYGDNPDLILLDQHLKKFNSSIKKFNIHFKLTKEILLNLINLTVILIPEQKKLCSPIMEKSGKSLVKLGNLKRFI